MARVESQVAVGTAPVWTRNLTTRLITRARQPIDIASLVAFRIGFGLVMLWWCIDDLWGGRVREMYVLPRFHFTYYPFDFIKPLPANGMYLFFFALGLLAACISVGLLYRAATVLFAVGFVYFFLLERANYQNHYYLVCLLSAMLTILPLNRTASVDVIGELVRPSQVISSWCLWIVRFHVALPYVFGGLAKFHPDWLAGEPVRTHLAIVAARTSLPLLNSEFAVNSVVWGGLVFDLAVVPLLLWRPARTPAFVACVVFHVLNAWLFNIHMFPWLMIIATTVFFEPSWPRALLVVAKPALPALDPIEWQQLSIGRRAGVALMGLYCLFHIAWPLRHHLYSGDSTWTERGHYFSWRMMLRTKVSALRYYVTDTASGETRVASLRAHLNLEQVSKFSRDPGMIVQFAHFLAREYSRQTGRTAEVRALVLTSLNGRKPELLIDPNVDLVREPRSFDYRCATNSPTEPLRKVAWAVPMLEWERYVALPPLKFLKPTRSVPKLKTQSSVSETQRAIPEAGNSNQAV